MSDLIQTIQLLLSLVVSILAAMVLLGLLGGMLAPVMVVCVCAMFVLQDLPLSEDPPVEFDTLVYSHLVLGHEVDIVTGERVDG